MEDVDGDMHIDNSLSSRKRPFDGVDDSEDRSVVSKKTNRNEDNDGSGAEEMNVKVMVPAQATGGIIGKSGETIANIQKETGCRVKVSKNNDFFPTTNERVVLISGSLSNILRVMEFLCEKNSLKEVNAKLDLFDYKNTERAKEMKIIIPSSTAGMVIGKAGEYIKSIKEITGAFAQISNKDIIDSRLQERVVTLVGQDVTELISGAKMVLSKLALDSSNRMAPYTSISYLHFTNSATLVNPFSFRPLSPRQSSFSFGGSTRAFSPPPQSHASRYSPPTNGNLYSSLGGMSSSLTGTNWPSGNVFSSTTGSNMGNLQVLQFLDGLRSTLKSNGYNETSILEITQAMQTLAKYNVLGLGLGLGLAAISKAAPEHQTPTLNPMAFSSTNSSSNLASATNKHGYVGFMGVDSGTNDAFSRSESFGRRVAGNAELRRDISSLLYPMSAGQPSDSSPRRHELSSAYMSRPGDHDRASRSPSMDRPSIVREGRYEGNKLELLVPDSIVGAVLGKQGRTLGEIQRYSGAHIEVSKRGTNTGSSSATVEERVVTVEGGPEAVRAARRKIEDLIADEQRSRDIRAKHY